MCCRPSVPPVERDPAQAVERRRGEGHPEVVGQVDLGLGGDAQHRPAEARDRGGAANGRTSRGAGKPPWRRARWGRCRGSGRRRRPGRRAFRREGHREAGPAAARARRWCSACRGRIDHQDRPVEHLLPAQEAHHLPHLAIEVEDGIIVGHSAASLAVSCPREKRRLARLEGGAIRFPSGWDVDEEGRGRARRGSEQGGQPLVVAMVRGGVVGHLPVRIFLFVAGQEMAEAAGEALGDLLEEVAAGLPERAILNLLPLPERAVGRSNDLEQIEVDGVGVWRTRGWAAAVPSPRRSPGRCR